MVWHVDGSGASAEGETSVLGGYGSTVRCVAKDGREVGAFTGVDVRPSLETYETFLGNISTGKSLRVLIYNVTALVYIGLRK